jgi:cell division protease FtsH
MPPGRTMGFWLVVILLLVFGFQILALDRNQRWTITYTTFLKQVDAAHVAQLAINQRQVTGRMAEKQMIPVRDGSQQAVEYFRLVLPVEDPALPQRILDKNPNVELVGEVTGVRWWEALLTYLPFVILLAIWLFFLRQMQAGGNKAFTFGKSRARLINSDRPQVTFMDVAGCEEAKVDLEEIIEFLKSPRKFQKLGGRIPKGVLLVGAPGTGKTLLAKAVAGEAGVPFFTMSGSDFVEMFVGVGASRVRDLFEQGKKHAPCIIFIDEIDAVGRHRGAGLGGGHDEREQTLNQLLVEMDGFETNEGVILIAATNRPDVLDPALLRPGRFDRQVVVDMPDVRGREGILKVHFRKVQIGLDVDIAKLARGTPGMCGADLANLVNEAALLAARRNHEVVSMRDCEDAKDRVMLGRERTALVMSEAERTRTAYHEGGHAIVASVVPGSDPVYKVTIIPRGQSLGVTHVLPEGDRHSFTKDQAEAKIAWAMGGRVAEELVFPQVSAGAQSDIESATRLARAMVTRWGMSERLGPLSYGEQQEMIFLGREIAQHRDYSERTAIAIDEEISRIVQDGYNRARKILTDHMPSLHTLAKALLERETLDGAEVSMVLQGQELPPMRPVEPSGAPVMPPTPDETGAGKPAPVPRAPGMPDLGPSTAGRDATPPPWR